LNLKLLIEESLQQKRELIQEEIDELEAKIEEKNEQIKSVVGNQIMKVIYKINKYFIYKL